MQRANINYAARYTLSTINLTSKTYS